MIEAIIKKRAEYLEGIYPNSKVKYEKENGEWKVSIEVDNFFGHFSKGFILNNEIPKKDKEKMLMKMFEALQKSFEYTAMFWFLSKKPPKKNA